MIKILILSLIVSCTITTDVNQERFRYHVDEADRLHRDMQPYLMLAKEAVDEAITESDIQKAEEYIHICDSMYRLAKVHVDSAIFYNHKIQK